MLLQFMAKKILKKMFFTRIPFSLIFMILIFTLPIPVPRYYTMSAGLLSNKVIIARMIVNSYQVVLASANSSEG